MIMKLIYITDSPHDAIYLSDCGVDTLMVDLESLGKMERQGHLNTWISSHNISSVSNLASVLRNLPNKPELLVRVNPLHSSSAREVDEVIDRGADRLMLPMFTSESEVSSFLEIVDNRLPVTLLLETPAAFARLSSIININYPFDIHIGLNDLHLGFGLTFMFELVSCGIVQYIADKCALEGISFGFGGVARLSSDSLLSPRDILSAHVKFGSSAVILGRDWKSALCDRTFHTEVQDVRSYLANPLPYDSNRFAAGVKKIVDTISRDTN